jgi:hypothetical protein
MTKVIAIGDDMAELLQKARAVFARKNPSLRISDRATVHEALKLYVKTRGDADKPTDDLSRDRAETSGDNAALPRSEGAGIAISGNNNADAI